MVNNTGKAITKKDTFVYQAYNLLLRADFDNALDAFDALLSTVVTFAANNNVHPEDLEKHFEDIIKVYKENWGQIQGQIEKGNSAG
jgi:hypothetical protein